VKDPLMFTGGFFVNTVNVIMVKRDHELLGDGGITCSTY
jgi:hypothetical protein